MIDEEEGQVENQKEVEAQGMAYRQQDVQLQQLSQSLHHSSGSQQGSIIDELLHLSRLNPHSETPPQPIPHRQPELTVEALCKQKVQSRWRREPNEKKGRFSVEEQRIISEAVGQFLALHEITYEQFMVILTEKNVINKVLKRLNFYSILSSLLPNRSAYSCYRFLQRTFNKDNRKGRWTVEQEGKLLRLVQQNGRNWPLIGKLMGRTSDNVYDKYRSIGAANAYLRKHSHWTLSELVQLLTLVQQSCETTLLRDGMREELLNETGHNIRDHIDHQKAAHNSRNFKFHNYTVLLKHITPEICGVKLEGLQWGAIAARMQSRTLIDCKNKFLQIMEMVIKSFPAKQECIISFIKQQNVAQQAQIDWQKWSGSLFTAQQAKNRFFLLKKLVPGKSNKAFTVVLTQLQARMKHFGLY